jgi:hypothetical protein
LNISRCQLLFPVLLLSLGFISGCEVYISGDDFYCEGYPEVGYRIPDITLVGYAERYSRALEADPPVFYHSGRAYLHYDAYAANERIAEAYVDNHTGILTVIPKRVGDTRITISAEDDCGERVRVSFYVDVIPAKAAQKSGTTSP